MKIYTKTGDKGTTGMLSGIRVRKSDDRMELIGTLDELSSHLGMVKVIATEELKQEISEIQLTLMTIMSGISDARNKSFKLKQEKVEALEKEIDRIEQLFPRKKGFVLYGDCELSARLDVARAVARRADRIFCKVKNVYGVYPMSMEYVNRLADYLYMRARYEDYLAESQNKNGEKKSCSCGHHHGSEKSEHKCSCKSRMKENNQEISEEEISQLVQKVLQDFV